MLKHPSAAADLKLRFHT